MSDRTEARITVDMWADEDFRQLSSGAQRLYVFLLSQRSLRHCGVLPLTLRRWAASSPDLTQDDVEQDLKELEAARYVVCDWDTEEVLIRTLLRNDGLFKNARMLPAVIRAAALIESRALRAALHAEVRRLPATDVKPEHRDRCVGLWKDLARVLVSTSTPKPMSPVEDEAAATDPVESPPPEVAADTTNAQVGGDVDPPPEPGTDPGSDGGSRACAIARPPPPSHLPPSPTSCAAQARPKRRTPAPDSFEITPALREWGRKNAPAISDPVAETELFLDWHRGRGSLQLDWVATWRTWMRKAQKSAASQSGSRRPRAGHAPLDPAAQDHANFRL